MREEVIHVIFLDLHNAYDALGSPRFLEILDGYGVGPRELFLFHRYWERLQMVTWMRGYYGEPFCG